MDPLSTTFQALADPTRRAILAQLALGERSVTELAEPFDMSLPAVTKHLKVLERAGLISRTRAATARLSHLEAAPMKEATMWMENYRQYWESSFDRLDAALKQYIGGTDAHRGTAERTSLKRAGGKGGAP